MHFSYLLCEIKNIKLAQTEALKLTHNRSGFVTFANIWLLCLHFAQSGQFTEQKDMRLVSPQHATTLWTVPPSGESPVLILGFNFTQVLWI